MNKFSLALACLCMTQPALSQEMSIVQIKVMQTRFFEKPYKAVNDAIMESGANSDLKCTSFYMTQPGYTPKNLQYKIKGSKVLWQNDGFESHSVPIKCRSNSGKNFIEFNWELFPSPIDSPVSPTVVAEDARQPNMKEVKGTTVRLRVLVDGVQNINDETYRNQFKRLADALFVNAIEISPATME